MNKQFKTELKYYNLTAKNFYNNHKLIFIPPVKSIEITKNEDFMKNMNETSENRVLVDGTMINLFYFNIIIKIS